MSNSLLKVSGLWASTDKDGNEILTGNLNAGVRVVIFTNRFKEQDGPNSPDRILYLDKREPKQDAG